ncbi:unnamed protein product [Caenorhabditis angaria]|uniref:C-type lectin domain-containing protein n=1 Tax=Caenorhabditis angaria TaxID=860376 RepID=A0A9P1N206_9PELO|nr:unnamed protein product [Caenorhabditis angaria]
MNSALFAFFTISLVFTDACKIATIAPITCKCGEATELESATQPTCPANFTTFDNDSTCYQIVVSENLGSWEAARNVCQSIGADIGSFLTFDQAKQATEKYFPASFFENESSLGYAAIWVDGKKSANCTTITEGIKNSTKTCTQYNGLEYIYETSASSQLLDNFDIDRKSKAVCLQAFLEQSSDALSYLTSCSDSADGVLCVL